MHDKQIFGPFYFVTALVDILWLSEAFKEARIGNFDIKPTDGATIFAFDGFKLNNCQ